MNWSWLFGREIGHNGACPKSEQKEAALLAGLSEREEEDLVGVQSIVLDIVEEEQAALESKLSNLPTEEDKTN